MLLRKLIILVIAVASLFSLIFLPTLAANTTNMTQSRWLEALPSLQSTTPTATIAVYLPALLHNFDPTNSTTPIPTATTTPTTLPTITATQTATPPAVEIVHIEYDPTDTVKGEYVDLKNNQAISVTMTNWTLSDAVSNTFTFPSFTLPPQGMVRVWVFTGTNNATNLYWGRASGVWNNDKDTATLRNEAGIVIDTYSYPISTPTPQATGTAIVTPMPTINPSAPKVRIIYIEYAPVNTDTNREYVEIQNNEAVAVTMTGWQLSDLVSNTFTFPQFTLQPQAKVKVWVITGTNDAANLYWGRTIGVWNNDKDTATLKDDKGNVVYYYSYVATPTATPTASPTVGGTPTPTPTLDPSLPKVEVIHIEANPTDAAKGEYVDIQNKDSVAVTMTKWTLSDEANTTFTFPEFILQPQAVVRVWVLTGTNDATNLYWGRGGTVWNNDADIATLKDDKTRVVHIYSYAPTPTPTSGATVSVTPVGVPTGTPPVTATVKITHIEYSPAGSDLDGEYVEIKNVDVATVDLTGWTLHDATDTTFKFPAFNLSAQATVKVWAKKGTNDANNLYWGSTRSIWNNTGEEAAVLSNPTGVPIYWCTYIGKTGETGVNCP